MKHILIVFTGEFKTKIYPLGGKFQLDHAIALRKSGIKTGIIAPGLLSVRRIFNSYPFKKFELIEKIPVFRDFKQNYLPARLGLYNLWLAKRYEKFGLEIFEKYILKYGVPDLIHAHDVRFGAFVANSIYKKYNIPFLVTECSSETAEGLFPTELKSSAISVLKNAKIITAASKPFAKIFSKKMNLKKIKTYPLYPVLPHDFNKVLINKKKSRNKVFTFITVNRLDKNKNIQMIIRAFAKGFKDRNAILKIIGNGPLKSDLKKISKKLGIEKKIFFITNASRTKMKKELWNSNCFLSSSLHETFGVVLIESLAYGIPIVSTKSEGPSEIVDKFSGILVKHNDILSYKNAMLKFFLKKFTFSKKKLRKNIIDRFGSRQFIYNTTKIYNKCMN